MPTYAFIWKNILPVIIISVKIFFWIVENGGFTLMKKVKCERLHPDRKVI